MDTNDAFKILGLPITATPSEINAMRKKLARKIHDRGGEDDKLAQINVAADLAIAHAEASSVVPIGSISDIVVRTAEELVRSQECREKAETAKTVIIRDHTGRWFPLRNLSLFLTLVNAAVSYAFFQFGNSETEPFLDSYSVGGAFFGTLFFGFSIACAICAGWIWQLTSFIRSAIEHLSDELSDKSRLLEVLAVLHPGASSPFTRDDMERSLGPYSASALALVNPLYVFLGAPRNLFRIMGIIGPEDAAKLILAKGIEKGLLEETVAYDSDQPAVLFSMHKEPSP